MLTGDSINSSSHRMDDEKLEFYEEFLQLVIDNKSKLVGHYNSDSSEDDMPISYQTFHKWKNGHLKRAPSDKNINAVFERLFNDAHPSTWVKGLSGSLKRWVSVKYNTGLPYSLSSCEQLDNPTIYDSLIICMTQCNSGASEKQLIESVAALKYINNEENPALIPTLIPQADIDCHLSFAKRQVQNMQNLKFISIRDGRFYFTSEDTYIGSTIHHYNMKLIEAKKTLLHKCSSELEMSNSFHISISQEDLPELLKSFKKVYIEYTNKTIPKETESGGDNMIAFFAGHCNLNFSNSVEKIS